MSESGYQELPAAVKHRLADIERLLDEARPEYEQTIRRVQSKDYAMQMLESLARIADLLDVKLGERADFHALVMIGRIGEIVDRFRQDQKVIDAFESKRESRQRLERSAK